MSYPATNPLASSGRGRSVRLLVVDDDEPIRRALQRYLLRRGYEVQMAGSGEEALPLVGRHTIACMLLDGHLPGESGIHLVPRMLDADPDLAIVMLSGVDEANQAALGMQRGALDYLVKPIDLAELDRAVERALRLRSERIEAHQLNNYLKEEIAQRDLESALEKTKLERLAVATLESLVAVQEVGDRYLAGHSVRVAEVAASIATRMERSDSEIESVRLAGRLHDIGKIIIPAKVLNKEGPLVEAEFELVKQHVVAGYRILAPLPHLEEIASFVRGHHEHWDGHGYPDGLAGEDIPWGARILGAAEVYDALTTSRPYQERMSPENAVVHMEKLVSTALDPAIHHALAAVVARRQTLEFLDDLKGADIAHQSAATG